jgi:hypothetical protein
MKPVALLTRCGREAAPCQTVSPDLDISDSSIYWTVRVMLVVWERLAGPVASTWMVEVPAVVVGVVGVDVDEEGELPQPVAAMLMQASRSISVSW